MSFGLRPVLVAGLMLCAALAHADTPPPPSVAQREAISATGKNLTATLAVDKLKVGMLQGDELGYNSFGWFCANRQPLSVTEAFLKNFGSYLGSLTTQELKRLGYPLAGKGNSNAFDVDIAAAPDFRLGGILTESKMETCSLNAASEGWIYMKIEWALFSEKQQKVVYQATTEGLAVSKDKVPDLTKRALLSSLGNFLAAPGVLQALQPADAAAPATAASGAAAPAAVLSGGTGLLIRSEAAPAGGAQKNQAQLRSAVVTLETAAGSGSGFFIDRQGHLLTNAHVVKGAKYARVKLQNGDKVVAEVLKVNEPGDVALLKAALDDASPLAIRTTATPEVGSDVYAIGSPMGVLTNSLTRGVLSADRVMQGRRVLQSDAAVTFGSSGGPLLDSDGQVIGITQGGLESGKGFNFFIPITDALKALDLTVKP